MEGYKQPEVISEWDVIHILDSRGIEDSEARAVLEKYTDQCQAEADREARDDPENQEASNRANIKAAIKIAMTYSKTEKYKSEGVEALEEALVAASQNESTADLAKQIIYLITELNH